MRINRSRLEYVIGAITLLINMCVVDIWLRPGNTGSTRRDRWNRRPQCSLSLSWVPSARNYQQIMSEEIGRLDSRVIDSCCGPGPWLMCPRTATQLSPLALRPKREFINLLLGAWGLYSRIQAHNHPLAPQQQLLSLLCALKKTAPISRPIIIIFLHLSERSREKNRNSLQLLLPFHIFVFFFFGCVLQRNL